MYRALKTAQNDLHTTLLKFADEVVQVVESKASAVPAAAQESCCAPESTSDSVSAAIQLLHAKQDVQFRVLNGAINSLNENMAKIVTLLSENRAVINTASTIPSIQPAATSEDLRNIAVTEVEAVDAEPEVDMEEEVDVEEVEEEVEEEEGLEVEEWTYKGRMFFKDSANTVYAKDGDDVGEAIGTYDPVKNILKKLTTN